MFRRFRENHDVLFIHITKDDFSIMSAFGRTLVEWAEAATVHGVQYVFTAGQVLTVFVMK